MQEVFNIAELRELILTQIPSEFLSCSLIRVNTYFHSILNQFNLDRIIKRKYPIRKYLLIEIMKCYTMEKTIEDLYLWGFYEYFLRRWLGECAVRGENLMFLKIVKEMGWQWKENDLDDGVYEIGEICAELGNFEMLKWAVENGACVKGKICYHAAMRGDLEMLKWARERGAEWDSKVLSAAVKGGYFECVVWCVQNRCKMSVFVCNDAAKNGDIPMMKFLVEKGALKDKETCSVAAEYGHFELLKWLRMRGFPWVLSVCSKAASIGRLDIFLWALENGCPCSTPFASFEAASTHHVHILKWLVENDCEWDPTFCLNLAREHDNIDQKMKTDTVKWLEEYTEKQKEDTTTSNYF